MTGPGYLEEFFLGQSFDLRDEASDPLWAFPCRVFAGTEFVDLPTLETVLEMRRVLSLHFTCDDVCSSRDDLSWITGVKI